MRKRQKKSIRKARHGGGGQEVRKRIKVVFESIAGGDRFICSRPAPSGRIRHGDRAPWLQLGSAVRNFNGLMERTIRKTGNGDPCTQLELLRLDPRVLRLCLLPT